MKCLADDWNIWINTIENIIASAWSITSKKLKKKAWKNFSRIKRRSFDAQAAVMLSLYTMANAMLAATTHRILADARELFGNQSKKVSNGNRKL